MSHLSHSTLWLELQTKYVDEHFERLKEYLEERNKKKEKDSFYQETLPLLARRIRELNEELSTQPLYDCDSEQENRKKDKASLQFKASLLATYLLVSSHDGLDTTTYLSLMNVLATLHPTRSKDLICLAVQGMQHERVKHIGFSWSDLPLLDQEVFVHNLIKRTQFADPRPLPLVHSQQGTARLDQDSLRLFAVREAEVLRLLREGADSMDTGAGIKLCTPASQKLKSSHMGNLEKMEDFLESFIEAQRKAQPIVPKKPLKNYCEEDQATVRITSIVGETIYVETADPAYEKLQGEIYFEHKGQHYYYISQFCLAFQEGDYLSTTIHDLHQGRFVFQREMAEFLTEDAQENHGSEAFPAQLIDIKSNYYVWLSCYGVPVYTHKTEAYEKDEFALLEITRYGSGTYLGRIEARVVDAAEEADQFNAHEERMALLRAFVVWCTPEQAEAQPAQWLPLDPQHLSLLLRLLFRHQQFLPQATQRFVLLSNALAMAVLIGEAPAVRYLRFSMHYLQQVLSFVEGQDVDETSPYWHEEFEGQLAPTIHRSVLTLLKEFGKEGNNTTLSENIDTFKERIPKISTLAKYILAANLLRDVEVDKARALLNDKILETLAIEADLPQRKDTEEEEAFSYGVESSTQEFKTSLIFPPNNQMLPAEKRQNHNVMKGVCGLLNAVQEGTLYLGVNDAGCVVGLNNDFRYLGFNNIDSYKRYVATTAQQLLGKDVLPYLTIEEQQGGRVVAIRVSPHPFRLVELDGEAYLRTNSETRLMNEAMRQQALQRKIEVDSHKVTNLEKLQHAVEQHKCVTLCNYASSNSGTTSDRRVEVYRVLPKQDLVFAYDRDKKVCRVFNINRIGHVTISHDEPWQQESRHEEIKVDLFRMTGKDSLRVTLHLDLFARNLLIEEYPEADEYLTDLKNGAERCWHFEAEVYSLVGVARFYLGLAHHITIIETPALEQYVQAFVRQHCLPAPPDAC